jgi:hypothetical protein
MHRSPSPSLHRRGRLVAPTRILLAVCVFAAGLLASGAFSSAVPAAPQDCLPVVGCVTSTTTPSLPLPTVTVPALPTTTPTTTAGTTPTNTAEPTKTSATTEELGPKTPESALTTRTSVRVRGHRARRLVELRLEVSKEARVTALLRRNRTVLARRDARAHAGANVVILRVSRAARAGLATLMVAFQTTSGESARTTRRIRLPR